MYNGGSDKDELLSSATGNSAPSPITSLRNQIFIKFSSNEYGVGKGFTGKIIFGNIFTTHKDFYSLLFGNKNIFLSFMFYLYHR